MILTPNERDALQAALEVFERHIDLEVYHGADADVIEYLQNMELTLEMLLDRTREAQVD